MDGSDPNYPGGSVNWEPWVDYRDFDDDGDDFDDEILEEDKLVSAERKNYDFFSHFVRPKFSGHPKYEEVDDSSDYSDFDDEFNNGDDFDSTLTSEFWSNSESVRNRLFDLLGVVVDTDKPGELIKVPEKLDEALAKTGTLWERIMIGEKGVRQKVSERILRKTRNIYETSPQLHTLTNTEQTIKTSRMRVPGCPHSSQDCGLFGFLCWFLL